MGTSVDTPVTGYRLYSDLGLNGDYFMIYDGSGNTNKLFYANTNLNAGTIYSYKVEVLNFNGPSTMSVANSRASCDPPSNYKSVFLFSTS